MPVVTEQLAQVEDWERIEDAFRFHAFSVYYRRTFVGEHHLLRRFVRALLASAGPIQDRQLVLDWYRSRQRAPMPSAGGGTRDRVHR